MDQQPIVVDLDGTLVRTDMLHESTLRLFRDRPLGILLIPLWLSKGKANLKREVAARTSFDPSALPYHEALIAWLRERRAEGRTLVLCTAADQVIAEIIAGHLGMFDEVIASDGTRNLSGRHKADALEARYGRGGFDYAGNSSADLKVWGRARRAIVVNASETLARKASAICEIERVFPPLARGFSAWRRTLRVHQWLKNALLFVPLLAGHELANISLWPALLFAFTAFSLCASSVYIANDLLDLESDRMHPRKHHRPFASGLVPAWTGVMLAPVLLLASLLIGSFVNAAFLGWLACYFTLTCAYSWGLKRVVILDCLTLAMLYTLRIVAGAAAVSQTLSFWLLAFSVFLFLSLAFVKRYAELEVLLHSGRKRTHGRGYHTDDAPLVQTMGLVAGYVSVLVLALYLNSEAVTRLYLAPELMWGAVPALLFWISWMWMQAHRGKMHDDPLVFAIKDRTSWIAGIVFAAGLIAGTVGIPWHA